MSSRIDSKIKKILQMLNDKDNIKGEERSEENKKSIKMLQKDITSHTKSYNKDLRNFIKSIEQRSQNFKGTTLNHRNDIIPSANYNSCRNFERQSYHNEEKFKEIKLGNINPTWDTKRMMNKIKENPSGRSSDSYMKILRKLKITKNQSQKSLKQARNNYSLKTLNIYSSKSPKIHKVTKKREFRDLSDGPYFSTITKDLEMNANMKRSPSKLQPLHCNNDISIRNTQNFPEGIRKPRKLVTKQSNFDELSSRLSYIKSPIVSSPDRCMLIEDHERLQCGNKFNYQFPITSRNDNCTNYVNTEVICQDLYKLPEKINRIPKRPVLEHKNRFKRDKKRRHYKNSAPQSLSQEKLDHQENCEIHLKETERNKAPPNEISCKETKRDDSDSFTTITTNSPSFKHEIRGIDKVVIKCAFQAHKKRDTSQESTEKSWVKPINFPLQIKDNYGNTDLFE
ncbi:unnamed protein product [Moneuplotes crassus]|uniref:Uncharacterized protein n=1 Tax=Euplotes crassus TaxID=5936 RepID=A0AAD1YCH8_EUPCR|nr:unnamed protein product [Moneuplotes crassus]